MGTPVNVFLVSQGANYEIEKSEGFIWAPQKTKSDGAPMFYWEVLTMMNAGDILLHSLQGNIVAVSEVMAQFTDEGWKACATAPMPKNFANYQEVDGWLVKCEYVELSDYLPLGIFRDVILKYKSFKHSAFDKNGDTNNGYCYILEPEIADAIIKELFNQQSLLRQLDYLNSYLNG